MKFRYTEYYILFTLQALDTRHWPLQLCILRSVTPVCENGTDLA